MTAEEDGPTISKEVKVADYQNLGCNKRESGVSDTSITFKGWA
jgi:hypothetical protein